MVTKLRDTFQDPFFAGSHQVHPLRCVTFSRVHYSNIAQTKACVTFGYEFEVI